MLTPTIFYDKDGEPFFSMDDGEQKQCIFCSEWMFESWPHGEFKDGWACLDCAFKNGFFSKDEYLTLRGYDKKTAEVTIKGNAVHIRYKNTRWPWEPHPRGDRKKPTYFKWRQAVLERDGHTCRHCGEKENLHAHHIRLYSKYPKLRESLKNGITLCSECHKQAHKKGVKDGIHAVV